MTEINEEKNNMTMPPIIDKSVVTDGERIDYKTEYRILASVCDGYVRTIDAQRKQVEKLESDIKNLADTCEKLRKVAEDQARDLERYEMIVRCCEAFVGRSLIDHKEKKVY